MRFLRDSLENSKLLLSLSRLTGSAVCWGNNWDEENPVVLYFTL